ncbi:hypothetical protein CONLIGDRAFT_145383 [Coniochaeta ligniaria NRRL 30616]|uniref:Uncharacterized protein n=1 Tax=Coniochaeta ligniaria NRRL 30616 TaxID=1408157 RepID=A0A1J7IPA8_9PEZI|nr:hypothetical protein CONLIGDRAFT_145383 [Coniochaeta ligniaria NRRL 30616]
MRDVEAWRCSAVRDLFLGPLQPGTCVGDSVTKGEGTPGAAPSSPVPTSNLHNPRFRSPQNQTSTPSHTIRPLRQSTISRLGKVSSRRVPFNIPHEAGSSSLEYRRNSAEIQACCGPSSSSSALSPGGDVLARLTVCLLVWSPPFQGSEFIRTRRRRVP